MSNNRITTNNRRLRIMHTGNILAAGMPGLVMIGFSDWALANMFAGQQDPAMFGMTGAIWLAIGISGLIGLVYPNLMKSVFLVQIVYKSIWVSTVALPLMLNGDMTVVPMAIFFVLVVIGFSLALFTGNAESVDDVAMMPILD